MIYSFFACFLTTNAKVYFWKRDWAYVQNWDFSKISKIPKILSLNLFGELMRQLVCQVCYTKYQFLLRGESTCTTKLQSYKFLLPRLSESFYFDLYTSNNDSSFWKESSFWLKKINSIKKLPISKVGSLYIWNFNTTNLIYNFITEWKNALKLWKMPKTWSL